MTPLHARKLVTIVCESALERRVLQALREAGAAGYTITDVRGGGARGDRAGDWEGGRSVEIKVLCDEGTAGRLVDALRERYFADYAVALWVTDALVARPDKFT